MSYRPSAAEPVRWRVRLLGGVSASDGHGATLDRFGSAAVAGLLARLALFPGRSHAREELVDLLWPDADLDTGRNRLRQTLFALRALLEPPSAVPRPVLVADRASVQAVPGALACDVVEFERAVREGRHADALALYAGELMPGRYDDWIDEARQRCAALAERATEALSRAGAAPFPAGLRVPATAEDAPAAARRERSPLPAYLTRFFGRDDELARLREAVAAHRLVTLTGPGGCGKTRLASAFARDGAGVAALPVVPSFLLFVPLVGCATRESFVDAVATALRLPPAADDPLPRIVDALDARPALLVLDNFEQLVDAAADVVETLLGALPELHVLATSRRALGFAGEHRFPVAPLPLPLPTASLADASASPSLALFVDRARAVRADFHASDRNRAVLIALVGVLEGLPLAIELAASRIRSVSPAEMLAHLRPTEGARGDGLALLARSAGPRGSAEARHTSMQRTIEWSWQLLTPPLQRLLAELTVFDGPCTAAAAAAVATPGDAPVVVLLDELVSHSLLGARRASPDDDDGQDDDGHATRFALDGTIRAFAATRLDPEAARALRARHRRWWTERGLALRTTPPPLLLQAELRDFCAAVASADDDAAPDEAVAIAVAWRRSLPDVAVPASLLPRLARALDALPSGALASRGHSLLGRLHLAAGSRTAALHHARVGLDQARAVEADAPGRAEILARALHTAASIGWRTERDAVGSEALLDEAAPLAAAAGDLRVQASIDALRGFIANIAHRDLARAEALHAQALAGWEAAGDAVAANTGRYNLAVCALRAGRFHDVIARLDAVAREAKRQHDWRLRSQASNVEGEAHAGLRDWPAAAHAYRASLELAWTALAQPSFAFALWNLPHALARRIDPENAARLGGAAVRFWQTRIAVLDDDDRRDVRRLRRRVAAQCGADAALRWWREGEAMPIPDVVALALAATGSGGSGDATNG